MSANANPSQFINITASARQELLKLLKLRLEPSPFLRLAVADCGCSGFPFMLTFEDTKTANDIQQDFDGLAVLVARNELEQVSGVVIDYEPSGDGGKFLIDNPNRQRSCGCSGGCSY
ncbi:MAG TPA: iron-sulfur cluster assembly accessory protein [bacterium]|nr:iron-sulfur cluster assembly accessory protein [bacterium]HPN43860.1 iron-sulfur cluster assembly accessory protein [bacterium]